MKTVFKKFSTEFEMVSPKFNGEEKHVRADCMDIVFTNLGATTATVNGMPLLPNTSLNISARENEWNDSSYTVKSDIPVGLLGVWVTRKLLIGSKDVEL